MTETRVDISHVRPEVIGQLTYSTYFIDELIHDVQHEAGELTIRHTSPKSEDDLRARISTLIERFTHAEFGFKEGILSEHRVTTPYSGNILAELLQQNIVKELEPGLFLFREPFVSLLQFFDESFVKKIGRHFGAQQEYYPAIIHGDTLDKTNHFTSFPEHIHFVTHLREDLDVIESFARDVRQAGGWAGHAPAIDQSHVMAQPRYTINPATCYHCYEGLQGEVLAGDGVVRTAVSKVHRYESKNHREFGRLLDFTMREVIFVGKPDFVKERRAKSIELLQQLVTEWELDCYIENANDPFFTNDFQVKASFQRNQEMKYELRMSVPYLDQTISVSSSNFHSTTFGNAFQIKAGKRPAVTGCMAFGLERWVFAFLAQYGLDEARWPQKLLAEFRTWRDGHVH
ncbi:hypothetical protein [Tumebacillus permanentifrigoris]|uniref:Aminoacyl-transfer RNA synthetases class-II family profile domain-containing protein n=1 Tax=Tumebacillus permanentifrigoris TaxID=378543 RepID=A0A316DAF3_9BACL|nr:hypothetical protein [Tumebacillus permanentifrigoris]PWK09642.1 hypothetical protein C7459_11376 [Tumebacillus permanentifrigoris]